MKSFTFFLFFALISFEYSYAQLSLPKTYRCGYTSKPLVVDGKDSEAAWRHAPWTDNFVDIEGDKKPAPFHRTHVKMLWDEKNFYFFAELEEPHVWGTLTKDESVIYQDNDFEIFIDPDGDGNHYFEFEVNALGTKWDLLLTKPYRSGGTYLNHWHMTGLESAVKVHGSINDPSDTDQKWTVEVAIPWPSLMEGANRHPNRAFPSENEIWRLNFSRVQWKHKVDGKRYRKATNPKTGRPYPEYNWVWSPQYAIDMHRPEHWGYVQFTKDAENISSPMVLHNDELIKQHLFAAYRAQLKFSRKNRRLATLKELNMESFRIKTAELKPILEKTHHMFEIRMQSPFSGKEWFVNQDGLLRYSSERNKKSL